MQYLFTITYSAWLLSEILLNRLLRSKSTDKQHADKHSLTLIWLTIAVSTTVAVWVSSTQYLPISTHRLTPYLGLILILTGMILRLIIIRSLGKFFTVDVTIRQDHTLKKDGFYAYLRHPTYAASLLSFTGFGISLNNWLSLLIIAICVAASFINRIRIEEKALIGEFGNEYLEYRKSTKAIIPFIY